MGNLFDSDQTNELAKLMSEQQKIKLREAIKNKLLEEREKEKQSLNEEVVESSPTEEDPSGTGRYVKTIREHNEKKTDNRQKVIREKNDLLAGDESVTAAQLRQANQDLWNRVQTSLASLGGGGLGDRDVIKLIKETTPPITLDSDDLVAILPDLIDGIDLTTDSVTEGLVNLYFTEQRVWSSLTSGDGISQIDSTNGQLSIDLAALAAALDDSVQEDNLDSWFATKTTDSLAEGLVNLYWTDARFDSAFNAAIDSISSLNNTDSLPEGSTNLYYTDSRARNAISDGDDFINYNPETGVITLNDSLLPEGYTTADFDSDLATKTTDDLTEGSSNLYYHDSSVEALVDSAYVNARVNLQEIPDPLGTTDSLAEGSTNLYYTSGRVEGVIDSYVDSVFLTNKIALDNLTDVTSPAPNANEYLLYNGAQWVPGELIIDGGSTFRGTVNAVDSAAPADPANGDMYINIGSGTADASWTGLNTVDSDDQLIWGSDQAQWFSFGGTTANPGVVEVREGIAVLVNDSDAARPTVSVDQSVTDTWYYTQSQVDSLLTGLTDSAQVNDLIDARIDSSNFVLKAGDTMEGDLTLSGDPTAALHAATKQYVDAVSDNFDSNEVIDIIDNRIDSSSFVLKTGDAMTGILTLSGSPTEDLHAATKEYVDNLDVAFDSNEVVAIIDDRIDSTQFVKLAGDTMTGDLFLTGDPTLGLQAATKAYVDRAIIESLDSDGTIGSDTLTGTFVLKGGDTMTGPLISSGNPTVDLELANKIYVDTQVSTIDSAYINARVDLAEIPDPLSTTDSLPEGDNNLYYTEDRVEQKIREIADSAYINDRVDVEGGADPLSTTDSLAEGVVNLYYTDSRAESKILSTVDSAYINARVDFPESIILDTTDSLAEGDVNLYYTTARNDSDTTALVDSAYVNARVDTQVLSNTDSLAEGSTNLYYTDGRVEALVDSAYVNARVNLQDIPDPLGTTDSLAEGSTNLYYTDGRVEGVIDSYVDNAFLTNKIALNNLSDVTAPTPATNEYLRYNGAVWEASELEIDQSVGFKGLINAVDSAAPASPVNGDMYINTGSGTADSTWTGLTTVDSNQQLIWGSDQASWFSFGGNEDRGVVEVRAGIAVLVNDSDASRPTVSVNQSVTDTWYYGQDSVNAIVDSEHAWNVTEHASLQTSVDSEHAWNLTEHSALDSNLSAKIDSEHAWNVTEHAQLQSNADSEHTWNVTEHASLQASIDSEHAWNVAEHAKLDSDIQNLDLEVSAFATTDLTDVDSGGPEHGQILMYDSDAGKYSPVDIEQAGGGVAHHDSVPPETPFTNGQFWFNTSTTSLYVWHVNAWVKIGL